MAFNLPDFREYIQLFGYLGIFLFFITVDQITFIPEEITLLTIGYLASQGIFNPLLAGLAALMGFTTIDVLYFYLTRKGTKFTKRLLTKMGNRLKNLKEKLKHNFPKTLLILCFIPRMRLWAPVICGVLEIPFKKFLIYDLLSLVLFTATYISLGIIFHTGLHSLLAKVEVLQHAIFSFLMLLSGVFIFLTIKKYNKEEHGS